VEFVCFISFHFISFHFISFHFIFFFFISIHFIFFFLFLFNNFFSLSLFFSPKIVTCVEVLGTFGNWFYSSKQRRYRGIYGNLIGLVITVIARIANLSLNPLWFYPIANIGICVLGLIAAFIYLSEDSYERKTLNSKKLNENWFFDGCVYAGIYYLTFAMVSAHGTIARYVGMEPFPSGIWVVLVIVLGILISQMNIISSLLWWFVGFAGWVKSY